MEIFDEGDKVRLQLKDMEKNRMLFDFKVESDLFNDLRDHMIHALSGFRRKTMSQIDPKDKIHTIIADVLAVHMKGKETASTVQLSQRIYEILKKNELVETALITRINSIIIDLLKEEYNVDVAKRWPDFV